MTTPDDRLKVPTNGHHTAPTDAAEPAAPTPSDLRIAVSPAQAAAGFGIIAALILLLVRSRRRGKGDQG
jgi:predicted outer membrane lipoprotein